MIFKYGKRLINTRNWAELVKPELTSRSGEDETRMYGKFACEPLERGYGTTIGNALRRVLLSSLQGAACVSVKISGVQHEFTTIEGVMEDVTDIVLNIKQIRFAMDTEEPQRLTLSISGVGPVTAASLQCNQHIDVLNPELHLLTVTSPVDLQVELEVRMGKGYVPADMHDGLAEETGIVALDASFAPVRKVAYSVEQARVGQMTNYDKLIMEIWTDGSVSPVDALSYSAKILKDQLAVFINFDERVTEEVEASSSKATEINENLFKPIDELELSVRATNCLKSANIALVGEIVQRHEHDMLRTKNFGKKSLEEIKRVLGEMNLDFGMPIENFEKKYQDWKRKQQNET